MDINSFVKERNSLFRVWLYVLCSSSPVISPISRLNIWINFGGDDPYHRYHLHIQLHLFKPPNGQS